MARMIGRLSVTINKILKARGMQDRLHEYRIFGEWERTVGPAIARHARPIVLRGGKLVLVVDSPAWMQQLSLMKPEIREKLNAGLGGKTIRDITLKLGEIASSDGPSSEEKAALPALTPQDRERIEQYLQAIGDSETREMVRRVIEKDFQSKKRTNTGKGTKK